MNTMELFEAVGGIESSLIERCESENIHSRRPAWIRWSAMAACFCGVILYAVILPLNNHTVNPPIGPGVDLEADPGKDTPPVTLESPITLNELKEEPSLATAMFSLNTDDLISLTDIEFLDYYGAVLNIEKAVPGFKLQPQNPSSSNGIFKNEVRGTYYDSHTFTFLSKDGQQRFDILLDKVNHYPMFNFGMDARGQTMVQSEINGVGVTIFSYINGEGKQCYHAELRGKETSYSVTSYDVSQENYAAALASVITDNFVSDGTSMGAEAMHTVNGIVNVVDITANLIALKLDSGDSSGFIVYLSDGEAEKYSLGDHVKISFQGNPITIDTIWEQQLTDISIENS